LCAGFGAAARLLAERAQQDRDHVAHLFATARSLTAGWLLNGSESRRYPGNLNLRRPGVDAARLISDVRQVAFSAGSACASGSGRTSHVLRAIGLERTPGAQHPAGLRPLHDAGGIGGGDRPHQPRRRAPS
jgi:cysteine desulfurase